MDGKTLLTLVAFALSLVGAVAGGSITYGQLQARVNSQEAELARLRLKIEATTASTTTLTAEVQSTGHDVSAVLEIVERAHPRQ